MNSLQATILFMTVLTLVVFLCILFKAIHIRYLELQKIYAKRDADIQTTLNIIHAPLHSEFNKAPGPSGSSYEVVHPIDEWVSMGKMYETSWACSYCGSINPGQDKDHVQIVSCLKCGAPK